MPHTQGQPVRVFSDWLEAFKEEVYTCLRGLYLMCLFLPVVLLAPVCVGLGFGWHFWVELVRWTLERAGPAFIKWGQVGPDLSFANTGDFKSHSHVSVQKGCKRE